MSLPEGVSTLAGRIATFEGPHHLTKRRASSTKKKTATTASWPHAAPLPEEFARAGFFYHPTANSLDNVMCFLCHRQLDGWEPTDNPALEHAAHVPDCPWAINVAIGQKIASEEQVEEDPMDERLVEARRATFGDAWPHESRKGWKCKIKKMVEAGWCYDPSPEFDDGVTCFYCNLSLDGWEPKDNPLDEHRKRSPDCLFFDLVDQHSAKRKAGAKRSRGSRSSKASRLSTQSNVTTLSEAPVFMSVDDLPAEEDDSVLTTATNMTTTSTTGKGRKTAAKGKAAAKRTSKTTRVKKTTVRATSVEVDEATIEALQIEAEEIVMQAPPKRSTRRNTVLAETTEPNTLEPQSPPQRATRTRTTKTKAKPRVSEMSQDESQLQSELVAAVEASVHIDEDPSQPRRGTKRNSDGAAKLDSSVTNVDDASHVPEPQTAKPKKGRKPKKAAETGDVAEPRTSEMPQATEEPVPPPKPKAKKGRKGKKAAEETEAIPEPSQPEPESVLPPQESAPIAASIRSPSIPSEFASRQQTPILSTTAPSPAPSTPTPAKPASTKPLPAATASAASPAPTKITTPKRSPSPQSSDAENQPPSSRPSLQHPASSNHQTERIPLAASTPHLSPSKRSATVSGLVSTFPWTAADLETIFLPPLSSRPRFLHNAGPKESSEEELEKLDPSALPLEEVVRRVKARLTSPEKKMSVEEWVWFNAARGEERLRRECERLVGVFETEGGRAMRAVEGVECVM